MRLLDITPNLTVNIDAVASVVVFDTKNCLVYMVDGKSYTVALTKAAVVSKIKAADK